jgi:hypothetical protein
MADRAGGDEAVHAGPHREAGPARGPVETGGLLEALLPQWRFDTLQRQHGVARHAKRGLVAKPLQDLLHDRQAVLVAV